jgi:uncharacterized RDD family membrane protein YckC
VGDPERARSNTTGIDAEGETLPSDGPSVRSGTAVVREHPENIDPLIGRTVGHFRIDSILGRGGMGAVYRAWDTSLERPVALKTLLFDSPNARARFLREARAQAKLRHPHVVPIHFVGEEGGLTYLVMDLVEGETLSAILRREHRLPEARALDIVLAVAAALEAAHAYGLIHRDIKPSNILVEPGGRVLLADFGLAKEMHAVADDASPDSPESPRSAARGAGRSADLTHAGAIVGTPTYLAPEQATGAPVDHRADIYALGITLYEVLAGEPPFTGATHAAVIEQHKAETAASPRLLAPELRPALETVVLRMIAKSPDARFATYGHLRHALEEARARPLAAAPFLPRGIGFGIDFLIFAILGQVARVATHALAFPLAAVLMGLVEARWGRTPGKRLMGLCTLDEHGGKPTWRRALVRSGLKLWGPILVDLLSLVVHGRAGNVATAIVMVGWFGSFLVALGTRNLAVHDRVSKTQVVSAVTPRSA